MLPINRLAQSSAYPSFLQRASTYTKNHPFWSSRLATRALAICSILLFAIFWFSPATFHGRPIGEWHPPHGMPPLMDDELPEPPPRPNPGPPPTYEKLPPQVWNDRSLAVKDAFLFAWHGYENAAFGYDELLPTSNGSVQNFNGWGVTIYDSLSTMLLMGLKDSEEYKRAMKHVAKQTFKDHNGKIPFFETIIRHLGGLLSAYGLSGDSVLLEKANELGETLLPVFESASGLPYHGYDPTGNRTTYSSGTVLLAEVASCQMEFKYLAHLTGRKEYFFKSDKVIDLLQETQTKNGLWSTFWEVESGTQLGSHYSVGGMADSAYEYLLKGYLLSGKSEKRLLDMYLKSVEGTINNMLFLSPTRDLLYVTAMDAGRPHHQFEHLACFYAGLLALGVETLGSQLTQEQSDLHRWAAEGLTTSCYLVYAEAESGLGPEIVQMRFGVKMRPVKWIEAVKKWKKNGRPGGVPPGVKGSVRTMAPAPRDYYLRNNAYYLRPETLESMYIMWKVTGDEIWRHRGWEIFQSINLRAKTKVGYGSVAGVNSRRPAIQDSMPSYFMAETLKYLYLLFSSENHIPLDKWVFNTEAHPFPIFHWKESEKQAYKIKSL
ncbi:glycoside hydrolase [Cantharellus anzutake]|uniref:glycoside hydrolase n=1 Tax=Cantharellus anzutake TaxID=1750568 RepID=UPI001904234B|nr:glycoside hydrolase [Cantharellus anzutake]KAF8336420.1 glycoside hydrolase [Cantharellus anzutake]